MEKYTICNRGIAIKLKNPSGQPAGRLFFSCRRKFCPEMDRSLRLMPEIFNKGKTTIGRMPLSG